MDVEGGKQEGECVCVKAISPRGSGRDEGVDKWVVRKVFRAKARGVSRSKPGKSRGLFFSGALPNALVNFEFPLLAMVSLIISGGCNWSAPHNSHGE